MTTTTINMGKKAGRIDWRWDLCLGWLDTVPGMG
jgi:hypothetical protein